MASVVGGWIGSAIVSKVIHSLEEVVEGQQGGLKTERKRLVKALPQIQALLDAVEHSHFLMEENPALEEWMWQFRDAVDEAEDFIHQIEYERLEKEIEYERLERGRGLHSSSELPHPLEEWMWQFREAEDFIHPIEYERLEKEIEGEKNEVSSTASRSKRPKTTNSSLEKLKEVVERLDNAVQKIHPISQVSIGHLNKVATMNQMEEQLASGDITNIAETNVADCLRDNDVEIHTSDSSEDSSNGEYGEVIEDVAEEVENLSSSEDDVEQFRIQTFEQESVDSCMQVGSKYENAKGFRDALSDYAIKNHFEAEYIKNEKSRITVKCAKEQCSWRLHASMVQMGSFMQVKKVNGKHTCEEVNICENKMISAKWICKKIMDWIRVDRAITVEVIKDRLKKEYQVDPVDQMVRKGKELAIEQIDENVKKSFRLFPALEKELNKGNPDSIIKLEIDDLDGTFQNFFVCFKSCIDGFKAGCRPYLGLDGYHLKGKYFGDLLAATACDANFGFFPVAFAVVNVETVESWKWFLECLKMGIGDMENLTFMSDQQKGLDVAVRKVFQNAEHRVCFKHFYKNFRRKFTSHLFNKPMCEAAKAYVSPVWDDCMKALEELSQPAREWVRAQNEKVWTRSEYRETAKVKYYTNRGAESFKKYISKDRSKAYVDLIDSVRQKMMVKMDHRRRHSQKWEDKLTPMLTKYVQQISKKVGSVRLTIYRSGNEEAEVQGADGRCIVKLDEKTCTCRKWQICGYPCIHAAALIFHLQRNVTDYVDDYFSVEKYRLTYAGNISTLSDKKFWTAQTNSPTVNAPKRGRPRGRPKKKRIKGPIEERMPNVVLKPIKTCGRCGGRGHNKRSCKEPIGESHQQ